MDDASHPGVFFIFGPAPAGAVSLELPMLPLVEELPLVPKEPHVSRNCNLTPWTVL